MPIISILGANASEYFGVLMRVAMKTEQGKVDIEKNWKNWKHYEYYHLKPFNSQKNFNLTAPALNAQAGLCRYDKPRTATMMTNAATITETKVFKPQSLPVAATPLISETIATTHSISNRMVANQHHLGPKFSRIQALWPFPVQMPRRTVKSCAMKSTGMRQIWSRSRAYPYLGYPNRIP